MLLLRTLQARTSLNVPRSASILLKRRRHLSTSSSIQPTAPLNETVDDTQSRGGSTFGALTGTDATVENSIVSSLLPVGSQPLGAPLPSDEHACSVSLPTWSSVVGYEEGDVRITGALRTGYPRFVYHPYIVQLMRVVLERFGHATRSEDCLVLPSQQAAARCQSFLQLSLENKRDLVDNALMDEESSNDSTLSDHLTSDTTLPRIRTVAVLGDDDPHSVHAVIFPAETMAGIEAKAYWQHTGEVVSSRRAEHALAVLGSQVQKRVTEGSNAPYIHHSSFPVVTSPPIDTSTVASSYCDELRNRIAGWSGVPDKDHVFLTSSGMAAIYTALRSARRRHFATYGAERRGGTSIVYGFPYLDTLKLCSRPELCPAGVEFFGRGDARDLANLSALLRKTSQAATTSTSPSRQKSYSVLFTEVPSNPLLQCPDLYRLRELADEFDFCLVVDDTISNWLNVDILETGLADAVCTSLTKLVSGRGDVIAGSVVTNPNTERGRWMQHDLSRHARSTGGGGGSGGGGLYSPDAHALLRNSVDFVERNTRINATAEALADWLADHPDVQTVYYPKLNATTHYQAVQRPTGGYGGMMSIILDSHMCQRTFYDALDVAKGPSLGTNFTLMCPYTLLAHYHELDFAMSYNVPPNLLRLSVGLESIEELQSKFDAALQRCRLYPKICMDRK